ncbi:hypothetical protein [Streptomyces sp. NPDC056387]|uniref:hypothetical protein n=1 Tax=Streptomyces sp. NPDC056387 TaxID=3345803 RepID=UPI0035D56EC4
MLLRQVASSFAAGETGQTARLLDSLGPQASQAQPATSTACIGLSLSLLDAWSAPAGGAPAGLLARTVNERLAFERLQARAAARGAQALVAARERPAQFVARLGRRSMPGGGCLTLGCCEWARSWHGMGVSHDGRAVPGHAARQF